MFIHFLFFFSIHFIIIIALLTYNRNYAEKLGAIGSVYSIYYTVLIPPSKYNVFNAIQVAIVQTTKKKKRRV